MYRIALGAFANMSFAENLGSGVLGDGFVGLGVPGVLGALPAVGHCTGARARRGLAPRGWHGSADAAPEDAALSAPPSVAAPP